MQDNFVVVFLVFTGVTTLVKADNDTSTESATTPTTTQQKTAHSTPTVTSTPANAPVVTQAPTSPTTPAPLECYRGDCNATSIEACTSLKVLTDSCKSEGKCGVVQTKLNDTYSSFNFSCAADCHSLVKEGRKVACCSKPKCTPDLSKPINNNNAGLTAVPFNFISFLTLVLMSVLVM